MYIDTTGVSHASHTCLRVLLECVYCFNQMELKCSYYLACVGTDRREQEPHYVLQLLSL